MLSPEVVNFGIPNTLLQTCSIKNEQITEFLSAQGQKHYHGFTAVLPCQDIPEEVSNCYEDLFYYHVKNLPVYKLLEPDFLSAFIRKGHFNARTIDAWRDVDQYVVVVAGKLYLSVDKDTYQELGLNAQPELVLNRKIAKYCVTLDLLEKNLLDSSLYQRALKCLKNHSSLQFNWIISWEPDDSDICPSSLAAFLDLHGFDVVQCQPKMVKTLASQTRVPILSTETDFLDLIEWIGATALDIPCPENGDYTSSLSCPEPSLTVNEVHILCWKGFFNLQEANYLLDAILELSSRMLNKDCPWLSLTFHGFEECQSANFCSFLLSSPDTCQVFSSKTSKTRVK